MSWEWLQLDKQGKQEMTSVNDPFEVHRVMLPAGLPPYQPRLCKHYDSVPANRTLSLSGV